LSRDRPLHNKEIRKNGGPTNSDLIDMHCDAAYADVVRTYREIGGFRFVTVDDILEVDGRSFLCARFGFVRVPV
jgi:hypothetical protein